MPISSNLPHQPLSAPRPVPFYLYLFENGMPNRHGFPRLFLLYEREGFAGRVIHASNRAFLKILPHSGTFLLRRADFTCRQSPPRRGRRPWLCPQSLTCLKTYPVCLKTPCLKRGLGHGPRGERELSEYETALISILLRLTLGTTSTYHAAPISIVPPSSIDLSRRPRGLLEAALQGRVTLPRVG